MKEKASTLLLSAILLLCSCGTISPVINQYERAGTLQKGNFEAMGSFTRYSVSGGGESIGLNNNWGFRVGYGLSDKADLKLRYERLKPSMPDGEDVPAVHYISIIPKFALIPGKFALLVPASMYTSKSDKLDDETAVGDYNLNSIAPQLIYTFTNANKTVDLSPGVKADLLFAGDGGGVLFGFTLGAGFSSNLDQWAIRPEVGLLSLGEGSFLSYGVALQVALRRAKPRKE